jgi:hypothetical protein
MYEGVPSPVLWAWGSAAVLLILLASHRLRIFFSGRRDRINRYTSLAVSLATLFVLTRYPSPIRYHLDLSLPRISLYFNYSLVIWVAWAVLGIAREVYELPRGHAWFWLGLALVVQAGTAVAFFQANLVEPFSLSAEARAGDEGSLMYLLQMVTFCTICAVYLSIMLLRLAGQTRIGVIRLGQRIAAGGLLILTLGAMEEALFLLVPSLSMQLHGILISVLVGVGVLGFSLGIVLFSPLGRQMADAALYVRLRPLGQAICQAWPETCLGSYAWWTVLDISRARQRLYRIVIEWLDLRRLLTAYLPDEEIPEGMEPDPVIEAAYLAQGLRRETLLPREKAGDPGQLPPIPDEIDEVEEFLLHMQAALSTIRGQR